MPLKIRLLLIISVLLTVNVSPVLSQENAKNYQTVGDLSQAIDRWKKEVALYDTPGKIDKKIETLLKISSGYIRLGRYQLAIAELNEIEALPLPDSHLRALVKSKTGNAFSGNGDYEKAVFFYESSLKEETSLPTLNNLVEALQDLKQLTLSKAENALKKEDILKYRKLAKKYDTQALEYSKMALALGEKETSLSSIRSSIQWHELTKNTLNTRQLAMGKAILENTSPSPSLVYSLIAWAAMDRVNTALWLNKAEYVAQTLKSPQLESYVFLELGYFHRQKGNLDKALEYARMSQLKAQSKFTYDSLYRSQHLAGEIYQAKGETIRAIDSYKNAISSIDVISNAIASSNANRIVEFNQEIQPIYRQTLEIILEQPQTSSTDLKTALVVFDKLRLSQLKSYFGDDCFEVARQDLTENYNSKRKNAVIINSIILQDKTFFLAELPNGKIVKNAVDISQSRLAKESEQWYKELKTAYSRQFRGRSQFFYNLIVKPFEAELKLANPKVLIFVHDGILRNLPMAALLNENEFLIEKWPIISSIGLKLTSLPTQPSKSKALIFGLSNPPQSGWSTLNSIPQEVEEVYQLIGGKEYVGKKFTVSNLKTQLEKNNYSILHLATHGYFGGSAETSFILAYDKKISVLELENILSTSMSIPDLLVLSACETAIGSELSLLGLAGVATRSGVASTLGSLWQVQDEEQLEVIKNFYSYLENDLSNKAIALQQVQIEQIRSFAHPQKWAALSLIGS